jgi:hypothetical protein
MLYELLDIWQIAFSLFKRCSLIGQAVGGVTGVGDNTSWQTFVIVSRITSHNSLSTELFFQTASLSHRARLVLRSA